MTDDGDFERGNNEKIGRRIRTIVVILTLSFSSGIHVRMARGGGQGGEHAGDISIYFKGTKHARTTYLGRPDFRIVSYRCLSEFLESIVGQCVLSKSLLAHS